MSILIKGMEMPTNCGDCPMCYDMMECAVAEPIINFFKEELEKFDFCTERHPRCPLVSVGSHGRLGDLDKLEQMFSDIDHAPYSGFDGLEPFYSAEDAAQIIRLTPTVIPAEEGE